VGERIDGLESIARGIVESNVDVVTGYPGGPCTPILENLSLDDVPHRKWSVNEKQAVALAGGTSMVGKRAAVVMKHVGVNVASDAIMGMALNGTQGGLVFFVGDDPGGGMSQNEQDTRNYADLFNFPIFEPATVFEAYDMTREAFRLSEQFEVPVMVRFVGKLQDVKGEMVSFERGETRDVSFDESVRKRFLIGDVPGKHERLHEKISEISEFLAGSRFNKLSTGTLEGEGFGIVASGPVSNYVEKEVDGEELSIAVLKIGSLNPFPTITVKDFLEPLDEVLVVEEVEPWIERKVNCLANPGKKIRGKLSSDLPREGSLSLEDVSRAIGGLIGDSVSLGRKRKRDSSEGPYWRNIPDCPMEKFHGQLRSAIDSVDERVLVLGDTGCSYQGSKDPYRTIDSFLCMGTSVSMASGVDVAGFEGKVAAVMGDSSFLHSGVQSLMNAVYHGSDVTFIVFDNRVTGETGRQPNPGTGRDLEGASSKRLVLEELVEDCNVDDCEVLESFDGDGVASIISSYLRADGVNVVILRKPCPEDCSL